MGLGDKIKHAADELLHGHGKPRQDDEDTRDPSEFPEAEPLGARQTDPDVDPLEDPDVDPDSDEPPSREPDLDPDEPPLDDPYDPDGETTGGSFSGPVPDDPVERIASPREDKPPAL
ncbi:hypothetical protein [Arthrobacter sp. USHLN218]|uniref:hypothetical protein n=1 Tax=Arthrobacter sp. USHLN218 TaxID=3081232 RepID=UPI00301AAAC5